MWKQILVVSLIAFSLALADVVKEGNKAATQNTTQQAIQLISKNATKKAEEGKGSVELVSQEKNDESVLGDMDGVDDGLDFKYYWVLLVFSSLSIIGIIVFKSMR